MFSPGQNVTYSTDSESFPGQVWGIRISGQYIVNVPELGRCVVANDDSLTGR